MRYLRALTRPEIESVASRTCELWGSGRSLAEHTAYTLEQLDRAGPEILRYVALAGDRGIVASSKRYGMLFHAGGAVVRAMGIGAVFTPPEHRGKGHAPALLRAMMEEARDLGYAAAFLYSDIDPAYYARLGFVALPVVDHLARIDELPAEGALAIRPATEADLDALIELYEASWSASPGVLRAARSRSLWRFFRWRSAIGQEHVLEEGGRAVGYLIAGLSDPLRDLPDLKLEKLLWLDEHSAPGIPRERVLATVRALGEKLGACLVGTWPRPGEPVAPFTPRPRPEAFPMIAPLAPGLPVDPGQAFLSPFEHF